MRCGPDHHTVNFVRGDKTRLAHIAFEAKDMSHIASACDLLGQKRIPITWGPVRHGPWHRDLPQRPKTWASDTSQIWGMRKQ